MSAGARWTPVRWRPPMRTPVLLGGLLAAMVWSSACGDTGRAGDQASTGAPSTTAAAAPAFDDYQDLGVGRRYTTKAFTPAITFRVPPGAWSSEVGDTARHFAVAAGDRPSSIQQAIVAVHRIDRVYDRRDGGRIPGDQVPFHGDFAAWLGTHPRLRTTTAPVRLMGLSGTRVDVIGTRSQPPAVPDECGKVGATCVPLFYDGFDPIVYAKTTRGRFLVLRLPGHGELVVEEFVQPGTRFAAGVRLLRPLLMSLALGDAAASAG